MGNNRAEYSWHGFEVYPQAAFESKGTKITSLLGVSSTEFLNMIRVQKAAYMLKSQQFNNNEIAFKIGFNSHSCFTKCLKKVYKI